MEIAPISKNQADWEIFLETNLDENTTQEEIDNLTKRKDEFEKWNFLKFPAENIEQILQQDILPQKKFKSLLVIFYFVQKKIDTLNQVLNNIMEWEKMIIQWFANVSDIWIKIDKSTIFETKYKEEFDTISIERQKLKVLSLRIQNIIKKQKIENLKEKL